MAKVEGSRGCIGKLHLQSEGTSAVEIRQEISHEQGSKDEKIVTHNNEKMF